MAEIPSIEEAEEEKVEEEFDDPEFAKLDDEARDWEQRCLLAHQLGCSSHSGAVKKVYQPHAEQTRPVF